MEYAGIALIPMVVGVSEVVKRAGMNAKMIPAVNLVLGIAAGIVLLGQSDIKAGVIQGIFIGLSASGLYSGTKNIVQGMME